MASDPTHPVVRSALRADETKPWRSALVALLIAWIALLTMAAREWGQMVFQWWNIDSYAHILLIPPIIAWLAWLRREALETVAPHAWWPGLVLVGAALALWLAGRAFDINLIAQAGAVGALAASVPALLGPRVAALLALPLGFAAFLVPFGEEIVWPMQLLTASMVIELTHLSGVPAALEGIFIHTPAGLFIVAEACSGVKFLIAMVALGVLAGFTGFNSRRRRALFLLACVIVPILANAVRAWGTIYLAQYVGAERAGGFDHIVYGWIFFGIVIAIVLGLAWKWFERDPQDAGWSLAELERSAALARAEAYVGSTAWVVGAIVGLAVLATAAAIGLNGGNG